MGFIRSGIVFLLSIVLFFSLFFGNLFITLDLSLDYENAKPYLDNLTMGFENITSEDIYYQEYECEFFDCLKGENKSFVLLSEKSKEYWGEMFFYSFFLSVVLIVLMFVFSTNRAFTVITVGVLMVVSSLLYSKINWLMTFIPDFLMVDYAPAFLTSAYDVFVFMFIFGLIVTVFGIVFTFFEFGMKIVQFFRWLFFRKKIDDSKKKVDKKEVKEVDKKEVENVGLKDKVKKVFSRGKGK